MALTSRGEDAHDVAQLREELASLRGNVDHIRSAMQDMHREVNQMRARKRSDSGCSSGALASPAFVANRLLYVVARI